MTSGVYEIRNTANGKRYVGSAVNFDSRWVERTAAAHRGMKRGHQTVRRISEAMLASWARRKASK